MTKTQSFPLDSKVETEKFDIIHSGDDIRFSKKNSALYKGALSNLFSTSGDGIPTVNGNDLSVSGTYGSISVSGLSNTISADYILKESVKLADIGSGAEIISRYATEDYIYTAYKLTSNYYLEKRNWSNTLISTLGPFTTPICISQNVAKLIKQNSLTFSSNVATVSVSICNIDTGTVEATYSKTLGKNTSSTSYDASYDFTYGGEINNAYYADANNFVFGSNQSSQLNSWSFIRKSGTSYFFPYMGCVDAFGNITGEPFPINATLFSFSGSYITTVSHLSATPNLATFVNSNIRRKYALVMDNASIKWLNQIRTSNSSMATDSTYSTDLSTYILGDGETAYNISNYPGTPAPDGILVYRAASTSIAGNNEYNYANGSSVFSYPIGKDDTEYVQNWAQGWCYGYKYSSDLVKIRTACATDYKAAATSTYNGGSWIVVNDIEMAPGSNRNTGSTISNSNYDYAFGECVFTNIAKNKGTVFDYGPGWCKTFWQQRLLGQAVYQSAITGTDSNTYCAEVQLNAVSVPKFVEMDFANNEYKFTPLDFISSGKSYTNIGTTIMRSQTTLLRKDSTTLLMTSETDDATYTASCNSTYGSFTSSNMTVTADKYWIRKCISESEVIDNEYNWPKWYYSISSENLISGIPHTEKYNSLVSLSYYSGLPMALSFNKCLLGAPNTEAESPLRYNVDGNDYYITFDDMAYHIVKTTSNDNAEDIYIKKVADYEYATNILDEYNFIRESRDGNLSWIRAYNPYANSHYLNKSLIINTVASLPADGGAMNDIWYQAAGHNPNLLDEDISTSFLLPAITISLYVSSEDLLDFDASVIKGNNPILLPDLDNLFDNDELDVYYTHTLDSTDITYKYTINGNEIRSFNTNMENNTWWITSYVIIFPIGCGAVITGWNYLSPTIYLNGNYSVKLYQNNNTTFLGYNMATATYYGSNIFTIYGSSYSYDKQAIYYVGGTNTNVSNEFVCYVLGLEFLANSGTEAYFYSKFDKCLYVFTGSNTVQQSNSLALLGNPIDSAYSTVDQSLYILTDAGELYVITPTSSWLEEVGTDYTYLVTTGSGCAVVGDNGWKMFNYKSGDVEPIEILTAPFGDYSILYNFGIQDIILFDDAANNADNDVEVTLKFVSKNDNKIDTEEKKINIKPKDWKDSHYRIRVNPKNPSGTYFQLGISSNDLIHIVYMGSTFDNVGLPTAPKTK